MTKKELGNKIEEAISVWETSEVKPYEEKQVGMKETVKLCREYIVQFKDPYKHPYQGMRVGMSELLLNEFEKLFIGNVFN